MLLPWVLCGVLAVLAAVLFGKLYLLRTGMDQLREQLSDWMETETNTLLSVSSNDRHLRKLASDLNRQLRELRKMRRRYLDGDRELGEAVTNISHDLRTPLTAVFGYLDLLEREQRSENAARYLLAVRDRAEALKQLTEELFRYSVILSAQEPMELAELCVNGVLEESLAAFYAALTQRGIVPEIIIPEQKIIRTGNKTALLRVFGNILSNAVKYSDGDLRVELKESGEAFFSNTARGLGEAEVGKLFHRFFSVETARNSTGLGLAIAKTLTEQMGGEIGAAYEEDVLSIWVRLKAG